MKLSLLKNTFAHKINASKLFLLTISVSFFNLAFTQDNIFDDVVTKTYIIEEVTVSGVDFADKNQIVTISGLVKGDEVTIPSDEKFSAAAKRLWKQNYFGDVSIDTVKTEGDKVWINIALTERPRIYKWTITGVKKSQLKELGEKISLRKGGPLSDYAIKTTVEKIQHYYGEKGYLNTDVEVIKAKDTTINNAVNVEFKVNKNKKVKIKEIVFDGNEVIKGYVLRGSMKKTKQKGFALKSVFKSKKFIQKNFDDDRENLLSLYNRKGYRDATILKDSVYKINDKQVGIKMNLYEGKRYYFRNIDWVGNTKYPSDALGSMLKIRKGDVYDMVTLDKKLNTDEQSVSTVFYQDHGYIFSRLNPVETNITGDSIDLEIRIFEGTQATLNRINISGNDKTNEHVVRRELKTVPGDLFSKTKYLESVRMLSSMGHFDAEELMKNAGSFVKPNPTNGTVDLNYAVKEKSNDQFELSGGWGARMFVGSVGVRFSNFSARRFFDWKAWRPVPSGDGQTLGLRFQTNGKRYQQFSVNFVEPWLGGRKPVSLSVSAYFSNQTSVYTYSPYGNDYGGYGGYGGGYGGYGYDGYGYNTPSNQFMKVLGASVGLGYRLKWPDQWFSLYYELAMQNYNLNNWPGGFIFSNGKSNNFSFKVVFARKSIDNPLFPRRGSDVSVGLQLTPPYSLFNPGKNYKEMGETKYKWVEYNKWTFNSTFFNTITGNLVLMARAQFGYLGYYNKKWGYSPFEGFVVGGGGMSGYVMYGQDIIALRGYDDNSLTPINRFTNAYEGNVYDKFTLELRHPIIMQQQAQIYALGFIEAGNSWDKIDKFNPFDTKRSAGVGVRIYLPIVGTLGLDWGYGFDSQPGRSAGARGGVIHFVMGQTF